jgi:hypothetical protein
MPPGNGLDVPQYVPLKSLVWYWKAYVEKEPGAGPWQWNAREAMWDYDEDFPPHPTWVLRHDTGYWIYQ